MNTLIKIDQDDMRLEEDTFGYLVMKMLPQGVSLAKLSREADVDYAYLHSLIRGKRGDKPLNPSMDMVVKIRQALENLGAEPYPEWELDLLETAVQLPEGYSITKDDSGPSEGAEEIEYISNPQVQRLTENFGGVIANADPDDFDLIENVLGSIGRKQRKSTQEKVEEAERKGRIGKRIE